jgi:hypothetical protein
MQRAAVDEETNRERERRRLNQQRWRLIRHVLKRAAFFVVLALVIIAALCGLTLGGLAAARPRRRRY